MANGFSQFIDPQNFAVAWQKVRANNGCAGVDGETIAQFTHYADEALETLRRSLVAGTYRPLPLRQLFIPKKQGWRELAVPTVRDRIVQQALLQILHPLVEPQFEPCSFAYRPGRSHRMAAQEIMRWRDRGYEQVLDADIVQYFSNIQHQRLLAEVAERLPESWIGELIRQWIEVGVLTQSGLVLPLKGVPQGAVVSPILANIYLDDFDELMTQGGWKLVRYADDFVLLSRDRSRLLEGQEQIAQFLEGVGLQLHPDKTRITDFERGFRFLGYAFAGEVMVPIKKVKHRAQDRAEPATESRLVHAEPSHSPKMMQQALVNALKVSQQPIPPPLFVVLGYQVRSETTVTIQSHETMWRSDMATLYLVQQGTTVRQEQERFIVQPPQEAELEVPMREVENILVFGNVQLTTAVISTCLERHIAVIYLSQSGDYKGHLWSAESANLGIERMQFKLQSDLEFQRQMARAIAQGKLWNSKQLLLRLNRKSHDPEVVAAITCITEQWEAVSQPDNTPTLDHIRGFEGAGAARYWVALGRLISNPGFTLTGRVFHPPTDPMNSLLSFGYTLLCNNVFSLLLVEGLNPYLGNLHGAERQKAYLAFDLMEEFRSPIVDTLVMKLVNQKIVRPTDFDWPAATGGVYLNKMARRVFLKHFEERMSEKVSHTDVQEPVSYRRVVQLQVQRYVKTLLNGKPYEAYRRVI
jgi:CRISPR-associated protein Cas1